MSKSKPNKTHKIKRAKALVVKKYPFDPNNEETYQLTKNEIAIIEPGSGGKPKNWKAPSQFEYDQLRKRLVACGCDESTLANYTISDVVKALWNSLEKWVKDGHVVGAELRMIWKERYLLIVNTPKRLQYWQQKEKDLLNRLVVVNNKRLAKNDNPSAKEAQGWLKEIWPFGEHCGRIYKLPSDLDAIYLAVGLRLDTLYRARNLVTEEMVEVIVGEWQFAVKLKISELNIFLRFGPCFEGDYMAYDDPLETFWGYIEADLRKNGLLKTVKPPKKRKTKAKQQSPRHKNMPTVQASKPKQIVGEWSNPMSKVRMMKALRIDNYRIFNNFAKLHGIRQAGSREVYQICFDKMDKTTRDKIEKA